MKDKDVNRISRLCSILCILVGYFHYKSGAPWDQALGLSALMFFAVALIKFLFVLSYNARVPKEALSPSAILYVVRLTTLRNSAIRSLYYALMLGGVVVYKNMGFMTFLGGVIILTAILALYHILKLIISETK